MRQHAEYHPHATATDIVEAIAEHLREPGARLCDGQFFSSSVGPLYERYGHEVVDAALREIHLDAKRRAASEIRQLRLNAARLKREGRHLESAWKNRR